MRKHFGLRLLRLFLAVLIAFSCTIVLGGWTSDYAADSKQILQNLNVHASLTKNGDMTVNETWQVNLKDREKVYRNLYRSFKFNSSQADGIANLSVYDEDQKLQYTFAGDINAENVSGDEYQNQCYIHTSSGTTEIGWFMPSIKKGVRTFSVTYTIKNLVHVYSDTAELYSQIQAENFSIPVTKLQGTIEFPAGSEKSNLRAWLHTSVANSNISIDSAKQVSFTVDDIPKNTFVEVRLLMPVKLFPSSTRKTNEAVFSSIQSQELKQAEQQREKDQAEQQRQYILGIIDAIAAPVIFIVCLVSFILIKRKNKRILADVPEYTRDIPSGNSPAGIANLFYFYDGMNEKEKNRIFSATILSLAQKGYIQFENQNKEVIIRILGNTKNLELASSERIFYEMISTVAEKFENSFTMKQFKNYAQKHYHFIDNKITQFFSASELEIANRGYYQKKPMYFGWLIAIGVFMIVIAVIVFAASGSANALLVYTPLSLLIGGFLFISAGAAKVKLSAKGEYDLGIWQGLKKYMLEFSRMKEYGIPELTLWEEYLVYATMMGISKEVCKQLKLVYPQLNDSSYWDSNSGYSYLPYIFWHQGGFGMPNSDFDFGSALGSAMGDISSAATRLAHPPTSNSSNFGGGGFGGGGFSGGGGGFGAGGGGGVR